MLATEIANAQHSYHPWKFQGSWNLRRSPSFSGYLFKMTAEQCSFIEVRARQGSLEVRATSVSFSLFPSKVLRVEANLGIKTRASVKLILETHLFEDFIEMLSICSLLDYGSFHYHASKGMEEKLKEVGRLGASVISRRHRVLCTYEELPEPEVEGCISSNKYLKACQSNCHFGIAGFDLGLCMFLNTASLAVTYLSKSVFDTPCMRRSQEQNLGLSLSKSNARQYPLVQQHQIETAWGKEIVLT
ncbi:hypothetical protein Tco_1030629 [Tanacetum coccineum]|uniref:Uncharacterized protein n=1 Tax=Tanacetum coccineum TaxID=301880 RepID=A0ABQ5G7W8_9ASTR